MCEVRFYIIWSSTLMFGFTGELRYSTHNSGRFGESVRIDFTAGFSPGQFSMRVHDQNSGTIHQIENTRFNYQARDSPDDLLARDRWRSDWFDKFTGNLYLVSPRVNGVTRELTAVTLTCSWRAAFCVLEYRLGDAFYQFSRRPPRGINFWTRRNMPRRTLVIPESLPGNEPSSDSRFPPGELHVGDAPPSTPPN